MDRDTNSIDSEYYTIPKPSFLIKGNTSRRRMGTIGKLVATGFLAYGGGFLLGKLGTSADNSNALQQTPETNILLDGDFTLGQKIELSLKDEGLTATPDGHIPYYTTPDGHKRFYIVNAKTNSTWMLETNGQTLENATKSGQFVTIAKDVWGPDTNVAYRHDYSGITSIMQVDSTHFIGITHNERRSDANASGTYTATVGYITSSDGVHWTDKGPFIVGDEVLEPGTKPTGAGQPSAYYNKNDGYAYIMYTDWSYKQIPHSDQIYLARARVNSYGGLDKAEYLTKDNGFSSEGPKNLKPVIEASWVKDGIYAALPSISFNHALNKYLCVFETQKGFFASVSLDLTNWSLPKEMVPFSAFNSTSPNNTEAGKGTMTYPTILSDGQYPTDQETGANGTIYLAYESASQNSFELYAIDFSTK
jgi:hypothetical protein